MSGAVDLGLYSGFLVGSSCVLSHLQHANDTILVGKASFYNLWIMKAILRGFEMISWLKVNVFKSNLFGINVEDEFLSARSTFLCCRKDKIPFFFTWACRWGPIRLEGLSGTRLLM